MADSKPDLGGLAQDLYPLAPKPEQVTQFLEAVAIALSAWQGVEESLYVVFELSVAPKRPGAAGCGFHALQFMGKLIVADAAVRFAMLSLDDKQKRSDLKVEWEKLFEKARKKSTIRNHCAHFVTYRYYQEKTHSNKVRLAPSAFDFRYGAGLIDKKEYTFNDLKMAAESFLKLADEIRAFWKKIPPPK